MFIGPSKVKFFKNIFDHFLIIKLEKNRLTWLNSIAIKVHCNKEELKKETKDNMCLNQCQVNIYIFIKPFLDISILTYEIKKGH